MVTIDLLKNYLNILPDDGDEIAELCLEAAKASAKSAGIPEYEDNKRYDLFICALAGCWYDNRNFAFIGSGNRGTANAEQNARNLINSFVLQLRYGDKNG